MPDKPEQRQRDRLMALLWGLTRRLEREYEQSVRPAFLAVMLSIRRLIQELSPNSVFRPYEWQRLRERTRVLLEPLSAQIYATLPPALVQAEGQVRRLVARFLGLPTPTPRFATPSQLAARTTVAGASLTETLGAPRGASRFAIKQAQELDRMVQQELLKETPTEKIADRVIDVRTINGREVAVITTGSFANRIYNRMKAMVAGATWDVTNHALNEVNDQRPSELWIWNAILDPKTCPVCAPLHGQYRRRREDFPYQPPVHPNCRCAILRYSPT